MVLRVRGRLRSTPIAAVERQCHGRRSPRPSQAAPRCSGNHRKRARQRRRGDSKRSPHRRMMHRFAARGGLASHASQHREVGRCSGASPRQDVEARSPHVECRRCRHSPADGSCDSRRCGVHHRCYRRHASRRVGRRRRRAHHRRPVTDACAAGSRWTTGGMQDVHAGPTAPYKKEAFPPRLQAARSSAASLAGARSWNSASASSASAAFSNRSCTCAGE